MVRYGEENLIRVFLGILGDGRVSYMEERKIHPGVISVPASFYSIER
jgi:hypothetical protein